MKRNQPALEETAGLARALAHPARIRVLAMLREGELCVCHITSVLGLAPSTVSSHLRELRLAGLIEQRRDGRWIHVRLADAEPGHPWLQQLFAEVVSDPTVRRDARRAASLRASSRTGCETDGRRTAAGARP